MMSSLAICVGVLFVIWIAYELKHSLDEKKVFESDHEEATDFRDNNVKC